MNTETLDERLGGIRLAYKDKDLKILWAYSGGICAFPECNEELIVESSNDIIGHICHIVAKSPIGPRGDSNYPKDLLNSHENLLLLCPTHHAKIDSDNTSYSVDDLLQIKLNHETSIREKLNVNKPWKSNISQLYYINIPRLSILAGLNGYVMDFEFMNGIKNLHSLQIHLVPLMLSIRDLVGKISVEATPLLNLKNFNPTIIGKIYSFKEEFKSKNIPGADEYEGKEYTLSNKLEAQPYIFTKRGSYKFVLVIDPKWITTSTSFSSFYYGGYFAGLCSIKHYFPEEKTYIATPLFIGPPKWDLF
ncbi:hypothetical protein MKY75_17185 [Paenibacillus sp. FSL L8-0663]|uniref:hypothetical protein n=1 Tax=Paenibacillus sp. FSL L8-0663 TaxID=2921606 RepID=UPI0030F8A688